MLFYSKNSRRLFSSAILCGTLLSIFGSVSLLAQDSECTYSETTPSIQSARTTFRAAGLNCAEKELNELLALQNISRQEKADAHLLLASVYFIKEPDANARRHRVKKELVAMYMADRRWQGQLEIVSSEFRTLLKDAREMANWRYQQSPELTDEYSIDSLQVALADSTRFEYENLENKKPWYTKWWALSSGVGLVIVAATVISSAEEVVPPPIPVDTLPDFPSTP